MCMPLPPEDDPTTTTIKQSPHISSTTTRPKVPPCLTKQNPAGYKLVNSTGMCQAQCDVDVIFTNRLALDYGLSLFLISDSRPIPYRNTGIRIEL